MTRFVLRASALLFVVALAGLPARTLAEPPTKSNAARTQEALDTKIPVDYDNVPLSAVLADIERNTGAKITVDIEALHAEGVTLDTQVRLQISAPVRARYTLKLILDQLRLAYRVEENDTITVGAQPADHDFEEVVYDLEGLLLPAHIFHPNDGKTPAQRSNEMTQQIVELIVQTVQPSTWKADGGTCLLVEGRNAVVVRNRQDVQVNVRDLMDQLYRLQSVQVYLQAELVAVSAADWKRLLVCENVRDKAKPSLLRRTDVGKDQKPVEFKPLLIRRLLAYNGQTLKVLAKAEAVDAPAVENLLLQPVVTADRESLRITVIADRELIDSKDDRLQIVALGDGESLLVPLALNAWEGKEEPPVVPSYRLTAHICTINRDGVPHHTIESR